MAKKKQETKEPVRERGGQGGGQEGTWRAGQQARRSDQGGPDTQPPENQGRSRSDRSRNEKGTDRGAGRS